MRSSWLLLGFFVLVCASINAVDAKCECLLRSCKCCETITVFMVDYKVCGKTTYLGHEHKIEFFMNVDDKDVLFNETLSDDEPHKLCTEYPKSILDLGVDVCAEITPSKVEIPKNPYAVFPREICVKMTASAPLYGEIYNKEWCRGFVHIGEMAQKLPYFSGGGDYKSL